MKRYFFLFLLAWASLAFVRSTAVRQPLPPTVNYTVHELIMRDTLLTGTCLGEDIHMQGMVYVTHHLTVTGNRYIDKVVHTPRDITVVGLTSGNTYKGVGVTQWTAAGSLVNGQAVNHYVNDYYLIGVGSLGRLFMHDNIQTTMNADGTVTSAVEHSTVECR